MKLTVTITKTADGKREYIQIMSEDMLSVNVVLVADSIEVHDLIALEQVRPAAATAINPRPASAGRKETK